MWVVPAFDEVEKGDAGRAAPARMLCRFGAQSRASDNESPFTALREGALSCRAWIYLFGQSDLWPWGVFNKLTSSCLSCPICSESAVLAAMISS